MPDIEEKVDRLEAVLMRLAYMQVNTQINIDNLSYEMKEFKNDLSKEMKEYKTHTQAAADNLSEEMKEYKTHTQAVISDLSKEMKEFKTHTQAAADNLSKEMKEFKTHTGSIVDGLSKEMKEFKTHTQAAADNLSKEMKEFKTHTQAAADNLSEEMKEFKTHTQAATDNLSKEMKEFKTHTQAATDNLSKEMKDFKEEMKQDRKNMYKQWGEMSNKLGTIVEDMVAPNVEAIGEKYFNLRESDPFLTNVKRRKPKEKEFDVIAVYDTKVILVEVKSTPRTSYIESFIEFIKNKEFYAFFPEYESKEIIPIFASLNLPDTAIEYLSGNNILGMAMSEDTMDIVNPDVVKYLKG